MQLISAQLTRVDFGQGHHQLSGKSDENKSFWPNQSVPSIYIMIELCYFSLDQWEIRIHLLWGKCFNIPHHCDPHLNQTKWLILMTYCPWQFLVSLSFFLHWHNFWRIKFTPKKRVNYDKIHSKLPIFCVITAKYTVNCQFFALNL